MYSVYSNLKKCVEELDETLPVDSLIAHYILENHLEIPAISIRTLSEACNTSQASISRFCRRINHSDFKTLKDEIREYNRYLDEEVRRPITVEPVTNSEYFELLAKSLAETKMMLSTSQLEQAITWIREAKGVYFFGSSFSNNVAKDACEKFTRVNKLAFSFSTLNAQINAIDLISQKDVAVLISFSGQTKHIRRLYRRIKKNRTRIIWITGRKEFSDEEKNEIVLTVSAASLEDYETAMLEGINLRVAVDLLFLNYTNRLRTQ